MKERKGETLSNGTAITMIFDTLKPCFIWSLFCGNSYQWEMPRYHDYYRGTQYGIINHGSGPYARLLLPMREGTFSEDRTVI